MSRKEVHEFNFFVGFEIKRRRIKKKMTQKELGNIVGLSQALVSKIEDGKQRINLDFICLVAEVLDCGVINIFQRAKDNMEKDEEEAERKGEQNKAKRISVNRPVII